MRQKQVILFEFVREEMRSRSKKISINADILFDIEFMVSPQKTGMILHFITETGILFMY